MNIRSWDSLRGWSGPRAPAAVTIGVFDGLHVGHQRLIAAVVGNRLGAVPVVGSFTQHPGRVLGTRQVPGSLLSFAQKLRRFEELGVGELVLIDFSPEISTLTGEEFLAALARAFDIRQLVVGYNFRMGRGRATGVSELESLLAPFQAELTVVPPAVYRDQVVSSSRIREAIVRGEFLEAREMLGTEYRLDATEAVTRGGVTSLEASGQLLPAPGRYRALLRGEGGERRVEVTVTAEAARWPAQAGVREVVFNE